MRDTTNTNEKSTDSPRILQIEGREKEGKKEKEKVKWSRFQTNY